MCGICGILYFDGKPVEKEKISAMTGALAHRGPDEEGSYFNGPVGLGFRRLAIIDIEGGSQPMKSRGNTIVFNGEIYNYRELKTEISKEAFHSASDTEVLLHLFGDMGERALQMLNGMFAFAVWNEERKELFLARDRAGIKPLYYFADSKQFIFSSEIRSLVRSGLVPADLDERAVLDYFTYRFVPGPHTILKNVRKVLPGHFLRVKNGTVQEHRYWNPSGHSARPGTIAELSDELFSLLEDAVKSQLVSDVPLGVFLSGGVDSSLVTALMAKNSKGKVRSFSIGFEKGTGVDESKIAKSVAHFLGTEHKELILTEKDLAGREKVFSSMSEPVADPTVLPTAILSEFARKDVTVVLTGEGGDELFAGYNRYKSLVYAGWVKGLPGWLAAPAGWLFRRSGRGESFLAIPDTGPENWFFLNQDFAPEQLRPFFNFSEKIGRNGYLEMRAQELIKESPGSGPLNQVLEMEIATSLADRLLVKVDSASMGHSLEARPPFLDHRVMEFALGLPGEFKVRNFKGKYLLRKAAERLLPKQICWRRKHGFIVPLAKWAKANSLDWVRSVLEDKILDSSGIFNRDSIQNVLGNIYNSKNGNEIALAWPLIVLSCWLKSLKHESS